MRQSLVVVGKEYEPADDIGGDQDDDECREDPAHPPRVEVSETETLLVKRTYDDSRNQESRDHEEHVDPDKPSRHQGRPGMEGDYEHNGESTEPVDVGAIAVGRHWRCRHRTVSTSRSMLKASPSRLTELSAR